MIAYVSSLNIRGTRVEGENPLPMLRDRESFKAPKLLDPNEWPAEKMVNFGKDNGFKVLPYKMQDCYSRTLKPNQYKTVVLENEHLRAEFLTGFGGKLYSLQDKITGRDLVFRNQVIQIGNIAIRNAWLTGGCEWNFGMIGHTFFTCEQVYAAILHDDDGNQFVRIYEFERMQQLCWQLDFHLPKGSRTLYAHGRVVNDHDHPVRLYWWTNMAVSGRKGLRIFSGSDTVSYITPSHEKYIRDRMEGKPSPYKFGYCNMNELCSRFGFDVTYPENFQTSDDYFFQGEPDDKAPWIATVYPDGFVFLNRSTTKLINRKMFTWGSHNGGRRWCEHLSEKGAGSIVEVQSGMATTQNHSLDMPANTVVEWTEGFSWTMLENVSAAYAKQIDQAKVSVYQAVDSVISADGIQKLDARFSALATRKIDELVSEGSGFGVLEKKRRKMAGGNMPEGLYFPDSAISDVQLPWLTLMETGIYPESSPDSIPVSWMTDDPNWFGMLKNSIESGKGANHTSLIQYGVMLYEMGEFGQALDAWRKSILIAPSAVAYRNIAYALENSGQPEEAEKNMRKAIELINGFEWSYGEEYMKMLVYNKKYTDAWDYFRSIPDGKATDLIIMFAGHAALETGNEDWVPSLFEKEFQNIREGDTDLTDIFYKYQAVIEAKKRGVGVTEELVAQMGKTVDLPVNIDYRIV